MSTSIRQARRLVVATVIGLALVGASVSTAHADTKPENYITPGAASAYGNGCTQPGPNLLLDTTPLLVDPSPWAAPWFFVVNFRPACDMHDAGYDGGIVVHPIRGFVVDTRGMSRQSVDFLFLNDLMLSCEQQIGANAFVARSLCVTQAHIYFTAVRGFASSRFDASPAVPGTQPTGARPND
jgi:hypothetical protein